MVIPTGADRWIQDKASAISFLVCTRNRSVIESEITNEGRTLVDLSVKSGVTIVIELGDLLLEIYLTKDISSAQRVNPGRTR